MRPKFTPLFNIGFLSQEQRDFYFFNRSVHGTSYWETAIHHAVQFLEGTTGTVSRRWMNGVKVGTWNSPSAFFGGYVTPLFACPAAVTVSSYLGGIHHGRQPVFSLFEDVDLTQVESGHLLLDDLALRLLQGPGTLFPVGVPYLFVCIVHGGEVATKNKFLDILRTFTSDVLDSAVGARFEVHCHFLPTPSSSSSREDVGGGGPLTPLAASIAEEALDALNEKAELHVASIGLGAKATQAEEISRAFQRKKIGDEDTWTEPIRFQIQRTFFVFQFLATHGARSAVSPLSLSAAGRLAAVLSIADCVAEETELASQEEDEKSATVLQLTQESGRFLDPRMLEKYHGWDRRLDCLGVDGVDPTCINVQSTTKQVAAFLEDVVTFQKKAARVDGEGHLLYLLISSLQRAPLLLSVSPIFAEKALPLFLLLNQNDRVRRRRHLHQIQSFLAAFREDDARSRGTSAWGEPSGDNGNGCGVSGLDSVLFRLQMFFRDLFLRNQWDRFRALATSAIEACLGSKQKLNVTTTQTLPASVPGSGVFIAFFLQRLLLDFHRRRPTVSHNDEKHHPEDTLDEGREDRKQDDMVRVCNDIVLHQMEKAEEGDSSSATLLGGMEPHGKDRVAHLLHRIGENLSFGKEATLSFFPLPAVERAKNLETFFGECPDLLNEPRFFGLWSLSYLFLVLRDVFTYQQQVRGLERLLSVLTRFVDRREEEGSWLFQVPRFRDALRRSVLLLCFPEKVKEEAENLQVPDEDLQVPEPREGGTRNETVVEELERVLHPVPSDFDAVDFLDGSPEPSGIGPNGTPEQKGKEETERESNLEEMGEESEVEEESKAEEESSEAEEEKEPTVTVESTTEEEGKEKKKKEQTSDEEDEEESSEEKEESSGNPEEKLSSSSEEEEESSSSEEEEESSSSEEEEEEEPSEEESSEDEEEDLDSDDLEEVNEEYNNPWV
jgi:hypothetical protein